MDGSIVQSGDARETNARITACAESGKDELNLASLNLELFPGDVFGVCFIRTLNLRGNKLEYLPKTMDLLTNLEILNISENSLRALPDTLGNCSKLWKLQLQHNKLTELPDSIRNLSNLRELYINYNRLTVLCDGVTELVQLESLDARHNSIESLPQNFSTKSLPNLRMVNLEFNPLPTMPWSIQCLQDMFPVLTNAEERRRLVKRSLRTRKRVAERLLV